MLDTNEILKLEEIMREEVEENLLYWLTRLNRAGDLEQWLDMIGMASLVKTEPLFKPHKSGKIIVIGESRVKQKDLLVAAKKQGYEKNRFEFYTSYEELKSEDFRFLQFNPDYCLILVGPTPHKGKTMEGGYSSVISALDQPEMYPPLLRLGNDTLKITKASFVDGLNTARQKGWVS